MATIGPYIEGMGEYAFRLIKTYGARNATTGWPDITYEVDGCFHPGCFDCNCFDCAVPFYVMVREMGKTVRDTPQGRLIETRGRMFTIQNLVLKDRVWYDDHVWEVEDVQFHHPWLGEDGYYDCAIIRVDEEE